MLSGDIQWRGDFREMRPAVSRDVRSKVEEYDSHVPRYFIVCHSQVFDSVWLLQGLVLSSRAEEVVVAASLRSNTN